MLTNVTVMLKRNLVKEVIIYGVSMQLVTLPERLQRIFPAIGGQLDKISGCHPKPYVHVHNARQLLVSPSSELHSKTINV